jgi:hypothetical protein
MTTTTPAAAAPPSVVPPRSRTRRWHGDTVAALTALSIAVVVALRVANRGLQELVAR